MLFRAWTCTALKSIDPDRPGGPIQSKRHHIPGRNAVAGGIGETVRVVKRQFIELVAYKPVEIAPERTMQSAPNETKVVAIRIVGRAGSNQALGKQTGALVNLRQSKRLHSVVVRISEIAKHGPHPRQRARYGQACDVALRPRKQSRSTGFETFILQFKRCPGKLVAQSSLCRQPKF